VIKLARLLCLCSLRDGAREELRRLGQLHDSRRYTSLRSRSQRHLQELDSAQEDQLHSAVNQAIHGQYYYSSYTIYGQTRPTQPFFPSGSTDSSKLQLDVSYLS